MISIKKLIRKQNRKYLKTKINEENETLCNCRKKK